MSNLPTGTVTFLFTDVENSTPLWEKYPEEMKASLAKHDSLLQDICHMHNGQIVKKTGDGFHVVFVTATDAVYAAIHSQQALQRETWNNATIKVRMGVHTGEAEYREGDYYGGTLNRAARIMSAGHGCQLLLSDTTLQLAGESLPKDVTAIDLGDHYLKGLNRAEHIYQINIPGLQQDFPHLNSQTHITTNLPSQLTSFIGRERELTEATEKLKGARLLTLIGPGGTGKTRLSIQLGSQLQSAFKDGVWLVELAPISDPSLVMQTIASALEIREMPGVPLKAIILNFLRDKELVLILDNCEHLVEASATAADEFLHTAPKVKIIASSREALGINGETVYRVPSLSLLNQDIVTKEAAIGCESIQLFVERASAANPKFQLTDENASSIAQICSRLDGIPLAIELAASRSTVFPPEQIAKRLDDRFKLLTGGSRTALPRQQTLRALIDWSYDILSEDERALLRRLSVFAGGWTFEAAETICNNLDVFEHLPQLVNKSLVVMKDDGDQPRYYLLETIRQYARDKLLEQGEGEGTRNRHLAYYLQMAETAENYMYSSQAGKWAKLLEFELDNVRTALEWGLSNDIESALALAGAMIYFWLLSGHELEGSQWSSTVLSQSKKSDTGGQDGLSREQIWHRAKVLNSLAFSSYSMGKNAEVKSYVEEAIPMWRKIDDKRNLTAAMGYLAAAHIQLGNSMEAIKAKEEALVYAREYNDPFMLATTLTLTSLIAAPSQEGFNEAMAEIKEGISLLQTIGNHWFIGIAQRGLGMLQVQTGNFDEARSTFESAKENFLKLGDRHRLNMISSELAHIERYEGDYSKAISLYRETLKEWQRIGHRAAIAHQLESIGFIAKALEDPEKSACLLGAAEALRERIGTTMSPHERVEYENEIADLKANMDEKAFASLWEKGRSMTMDEAIEFATKEENE